MLPVFEDELGQWWYEMFGVPFGPYKDKDIAIDAFNEHTGQLANGCPHCED